MDRRILYILPLALSPLLMPLAPEAFHLLGKALLSRETSVADRAAAHRTEREFDCVSKKFGRPRNWVVPVFAGFSTDTGGFRAYQGPFQGLIFTDYAQAIHDDAGRGMSLELTNGPAYVHGAPGTKDLTIAERQIADLIVNLTEQVSKDGVSAVQPGEDPALSNAYGVQIRLNQISNGWLWQKPFIGKNAGVCYRVEYPEWEKGSDSICNDKGNVTVAHTPGTRIVHVDRNGVPITSESHSAAQENLVAYAVALQKAGKVRFSQNATATSCPAGQ